MVDDAPPQERCPICGMMVFVKDGKLLAHKGGGTGFNCPWSGAASSGQR